MRKIIIKIIEYVGIPIEPTKWYLTVGRAAPWRNFHIRVPVWFATTFLKIRTKYKKIRGKK